MVSLMYLSIFLGFILPAVFLQAIRKIIQKKNNTIEIISCCLGSGMIIMTLLLLHS